MSTKILFILGGTGVKAKTLKSIYEPDSSDESFTDDAMIFNKDVCVVYFAGCQEKAMGGSSLKYYNVINPNLDQFGEKIRSCFVESQDGTEFKLDLLEKLFKDNIIINRPVEDLDINWQNSIIESAGANKSSEKQNIVTNITEIAMIGYSRGAVTAFTLVRYLDQLGIPMSIFAEDPVPGELVSTSNKGSPRSLFSSNFSLVECKNLVYAEIIIGAYTKEHNIRSILNNRWIGMQMLEPKFFKQCIPQISPETCNLRVYTLPRSSHHLAGSVSNEHMKDFFRKREILQSKEAVNSRNSPAQNLAETNRINENIVQNHSGENSYQIESVPKEDTMENVMQKLNKWDEKFLVPKIKRQRLLPGVNVNLSISEFYKQAIYNYCACLLWEAPLDPTNFKITQAQYALFQIVDRTEPIFLKLVRAVSNDISILATALREFIVEFENINYYFFREENVYSQTNESLQRFRKNVSIRIFEYYLNNKQYYCREDYKDEKDTYGYCYDSDKTNPEAYRQKHELVCSIMKELDQLMKDNSLGNNDIRKNYYKTMELFLEGNVLLYPELTKYIDEEEDHLFNEDFENKIRNVELYKIYLEKTENISEIYDLAKKLLLSSKKKKNEEYAKFAPKLKILVRSTEDLKEILRFMSPKNIYASMKKLGLLRYINSIEDANKIFVSLFNDKQRSAFFKAIKDKLPNLNYSTEELSKTFVYLSENKQQQLINCIQLDQLLPDLRPYNIKKIINDLSKQLFLHLTKKEPLEKHLKEQIMNFYAPKRKSSPLCCIASPKNKVEHRNIVPNLNNSIKTTSQNRFDVLKISDHNSSSMFIAPAMDLRSRNKKILNINNDDFNSDTDAIKQDLEMQLNAKSRSAQTKNEYTGDGNMPQIQIIRANFEFQVWHDEQKLDITQNKIKQDEHAKEGNKPLAQTIAFEQSSINSPTKYIASIEDLATQNEENVQSDNDDDNIFMENRTKVQVSNMHVAHNQVQDIKEDRKLQNNQKNYLDKDNSSSSISIIAPHRSNHNINIVGNKNMSKQEQNNCKMDVANGLQCKNLMFRKRSNKYLNTHLETQKTTPLKAEKIDDKFIHINIKAQTNNKFFNTKTPIQQEEAKEPTKSNENPSIKRRCSRKRGRKIFNK